MATELATYEGSFWWGSLAGYAPEGGSDGSASQHGGGLGVGGLGGVLSSMGDSSE